MNADEARRITKDALAAARIRGVENVEPYVDLALVRIREAAEKGEEKAAVLSYSRFSNAACVAQWRELAGAVGRIIGLYGFSIAYVEDFDRHEFQVEARWD